MEVSHQYVKKRNEFGHRVEFDETPAQLLASFESSREYDGDYVKRNPVVTTIDACPLMAEHEVETDQVMLKSTGMRHTEGGWPDNVDGTENEQVDRYLKKATKDVRFKNTVVTLAQTMEAAVRQNNAIDIYERYFLDSAGKAGRGGSGGGKASASLAAAAGTPATTGASGAAGVGGGDKAGAASATPAQQAVKSGGPSAVYDIPEADAAALAASFETPVLSPEAPFLRGIATLHDPAAVRRTATSISWHPEGSRLAVSYSLLRFQDDRLVAGTMPPQSYIWDLATPNAPAAEIVPPSPLVCLRFNPKTPDILAGGCYNGTVALFDVKRPRALVAVSSLDRSHHDPVYDVFWVQSKTNSQFVSCSTDGNLLWWDARKLSEPTDSLQLCVNGQGAGGFGAGSVFGACALEYNIEAGPAKYLVGTEQGAVMALNMRKKAASSSSSAAGKGGAAAAAAGGSSATNIVDPSVATPMDLGSGRHHGPVASIQRNPFYPSAYMTVGDWGVRLWHEKNRNPIVMSPYATSFLTAGCWSYCRPSVLYACRSDGVLDCWDMLYRQDAPAYTHRVSDAPLTSIAAQQVPSQSGSGQPVGGRFLAVGDVNGTVSLLEASPGLVHPQPDERGAMAALLERESRREEGLEKRAQAAMRAARSASVSGATGGAAMMAAAAVASVNAANGSSGTASSPWTGREPVPLGAGPAAGSGAATTTGGRAGAGGYGFGCSSGVDGNNAATQNSDAARVKEAEAEFFRALGMSQP